MTSPTDLPALTLLLQEIQSLTSSMRRNQRWASGSAQHFAASQPPLPPYLRTGRKRASPPRKSRASIDGSVTPSVDEGDLMGGFVELRRSLIETKGEAT
jgi:brefeldin A-resistance guanine nucleotide exchange factor 1